jgi:conjugative transfer signal peptidase TraF
MRAPGPLLLSALLAASLGLAAYRPAAPALLLNTTPSEPLGLYHRIDTPIRPGVRIAFRPPAAARAFLNHTGQGRVSLLKTVVAGPGAVACVEGAVLVVDGRRLGSVAARDRSGRALPHWSGCRRLAADEHLVFSSAIPNSFDSRYYGPIRQAEILGVYAPMGERSLRDGGR